MKKVLSLIIALLLALFPFSTYATEDSKAIENFFEGVSPLLGYSDEEASWISEDIVNLHKQVQDIIKPYIESDVGAVSWKRLTKDWKSCVSEVCSVIEDSDDLDEEKRTTVINLLGNFYNSLEKEFYNAKAEEEPELMAIFNGFMIGLSDLKNSFKDSISSEKVLEKIEAFGRNSNLSK